MPAAVPQPDEPRSDLQVIVLAHVYKEAEKPHSWPKQESNTLA
jgi:hypothetical protein